VIDLGKDEVDNTKDLILNIFVEDFVENMETEMSTWYIEVMEFLKKVFWGDIELQIYLYIK
jgi:hypothetical protein